MTRRHFGRRPAGTGSGCRGIREADWGFRGERRRRCTGRSLARVRRCQCAMRRRRWKRCVRWARAARMRRCRSARRAIVAGWCSCSPGRAVSGHRWVARCWRNRRCLRETIAACETALSGYTDWSLRSVLCGDESVEACLLERVDVIQPALFAMNVGLAAVWRSLGRGAVGRCGSQPGRDRSGGRCRHPDP